MPTAERRQQDQSPSTTSGKRARLGFVGLGWIGLHRMQSIIESEVATVDAVADFDQAARSAALESAPDATPASSLEELLEMDLDGVVIATPSGLHPEQVQQALQQGVAVFCQKPLARTARETRELVKAAKAADCLLQVDFCYRHVRGMQQAQQLIRSGGIGKVFMVDLVFHNAYGPDKEWFYDLSRSGGGCVVDLGTHLIDLCHWLLGTPRFSNVRSKLWKHGEPYTATSNEVEDAAIAEWSTPQGADVRLACSWNLHAGTDAVIEARVYGTEGAVVLKNLNGSFYDLVVEHHVGTQRTPLADVDSQWGGRALVDWAEQLNRRNRFDPQIEHVIDVAQLIDEVYQR